MMLIYARVCSLTIIIIILIQKNVNTLEKVMLSCKYLECVYTEKLEGMLL